MTHRTPCAEAPGVQAYFDGELDALAAAAIESHIATCAECRAWHDDLGRLRSGIRSELALPGATPALRQRLLAALDREDADSEPAADALARPRVRARSFWFGALTGAGTAIAAALVLFRVLPPADSTVEELINAHQRSLLPAHLIDVVSTDQHTVKPWFAGHADVSPAVADFSPQGYRLIGGRADYVAHQRAAVVVYQHGQHVINVFTWRRQSGVGPGSTTREGYHLDCWHDADLEYCAVSDTAWDELRALVSLVREKRRLSE